MGLMDELIAASGDVTDAFAGNRRGGNRQPEDVPIATINRRDRSEAKLLWPKARRMRCLALFVECISDALEAHAKLQPDRPSALLFGRVAAAVAFGIIGMRFIAGTRSATGALLKARL
jgi:hypothetical protein